MNRPEYVIDCGFPGICRNSAVSRGPLSRSRPSRLAVMVGRKTISGGKIKTIPAAGGLLASGAAGALRHRARSGR